MLFTASWLLLVQQVVCIARGVRLRQWKRSRDTSRLTLAKVMQNCFNFWFRYKRFISFVVLLAYINLDMIYCSVHLVMGFFFVNRWSSPPVMRRSC
jgi:hypothetical protein